MVRWRGRAEEVFGVAGRNNRAEKRGHEFGTFAGVFTPCVLTIFGVIIFLRTGYVVGNAGIRNALLILLVAKGTTSLPELMRVLKQ